MANDNRRLGRAYFNEGRRRYGRVDIALIYYDGESESGECRLSQLEGNRPRTLKPS